MAKKDTGRLALLPASLLALLALQGCLTSTPALRQARKWFNAGDYDQAREILLKAAAEKPGSTEIKTLLFRAQLNSYQRHLFLARSKRQAQDRAGAVLEYQQALAVFPGNAELAGELEAYINPAKAAREEKTKSALAPPVQLDVRKDEKVSLSLKNTPITNIFKSLGRSFGINFIFDKDFRDFMHSIEIQNTTFFEIMKVLCMVSSSQYRVLDPHSVIVYPDIFAKKKTFDLRGIKTFFLSNIKAEDARKTVQTVFRDEQLLIQEDANLNALVVRADYDSLVDVERFLAKIDKGKSEVEINVEILEINRSLINKLGADFSNSVFGIAGGTLDSEGKVSSILNVKDLSSTNFFLTLPTAALNFLETDSNNKIIAKPNLRGIDGEEISFMVGDEVPIAETQYQAIAAGGVNTTPITTYRYRNVGVEIKITPFVHQNNEVTLKTKLTINFISSGASSSFPTFGKREIENRIRLKEGESNIIGGLIRDDIRGSMNGLPLLAKIPLLGKLFGYSEKNINQTDLIFSITPKIIRRTVISDKDNEAIWSGGEPAAGASAAPRRSDAVEAEMAADAEEAAAARTDEESEEGEAGSEEEETSDEEPPQAGNRVTISPTPARVPVNSDAYFSLRVQANSPLASLAVSGTLSGGPCEIVELRTGNLNESNVKMLKNVSANSFDLGLSFITSSAQTLADALIQLKVKFASAGKFALNVGSVNAYDAKRNRVEIAGATCPIDVY
jgi:general secretion pathway protein D